MADLGTIWGRRTALTQRCACDGRLLGHHASIRFVLGMLFIVLVLAMPAVTVISCSAPALPLAGPGDRLIPGRVVYADLDGDGEGETVGVDQEGALVISDTDVTYRNRDQWTVMEACLGDTDGNGILEVVALLDDSEGRHLGLFAWMGGRYRERIVTAVLRPRPVALQIIPAGAAKAGPDLVLLTEELPGGQALADGSSDHSAVTKTLYRWNGFGFTAVDSVRP
jgi:hypothetical protein